MRPAAPLQAMPLIVLSADALYGPQFPLLIVIGKIGGDVPADFGYVIDAAQKHAQAWLATLAPGVLHITETRSGHMMHHEQPLRVVGAIAAVVEAVRGGTALVLR